MATNQFNCVLNHVRKVIGLQEETERTDGQLLDRFVNRQDERAFETLVRRHGPMVQRVCRRILNDPHAAEDAFQATFLVLARKASSIRNRNSIAGWLYEVAYHLALRARAEAARRQRLERRAQAMGSNETVSEEEEQELYTVLDEELHRLPEKYRTPLILCYLEGKTNMQAAQELGWPSGSMASRLTRAREMLRDRLAGRGITTTAGGLAALLAENAAPAAVAGPLVRNTVQAALLFAAGQSSVACVVSTQALLLAEGMVQTMMTTKLKLATALLLAVGLLGTGTSAWLQPGAAAQNPAGQAVPTQTPSQDKQADLFGDPLPEGALARMGTIRWRHGGGVYFVAYTAQGKELVTGSHDGFFRVWDVATGKELRRFGKAQTMASGLSGTFAVNGAVVVGTNLAAVSSVLLSPDGKILAVTGQDGVIHLWDVATGKELPALGTPSQEGRAASGSFVLAFSPDSKILAVKSGSGPSMGIRLWDVSTAKQIRQFGQAPGAKAAARVAFIIGGKTLAFSPDGKQLATVDMKQNNQQPQPFVSIYDVESGKELRQIEGPANVPFFGTGGVAFAPKGKGLAWSLADGTVRIYDPDSGKEILKIGQEQQRGQFFNLLLFAPDGKLLATRSNTTAVIQLWDVETGKEVRTLGEVPAQGVGNVIVRIGGGYGGSAVNLAFAPDGRTLAEGLLSGTVRIWDISTGTEVPPVRGHQAGVSNMAVSPDGKVLTTRGLDNTIRQWDLATGKELRQLKVPAGTGIAVLSEDGKLAALRLANGSLQIWDLEADKELRTIEVRGQPALALTSVGATGLAFSPDNKILAVKSNEPIIRLFDVATGKEMNPINEQVGPAPNLGTAVLSSVYYGGRTILAFSPDGSPVATVGSAPAAQPNQNRPMPLAPPSIVRLWNVRLGKMALQFEAGQRGISALAFAPDGRTIVTANSDGTISVWEILSGKECFQFKLKADQKVPANTVEALRLGYRPAGIIRSLAISPDGRTLAVGTPEQTIRLWDLHSGKELGEFKGHQGDILDLVFAPDSQTLISGSADTTALVWDGKRFIKKEPAAAVELAAQQVNDLWNDLAGDAAQAHKAIMTLGTAPRQAVALLRERVKPAAGIEAQRIKQLIADLDSEQFETRQKATEELEKLGELAKTALQKTLDGNPALETRQRIEKLLDRLVTNQVTQPDQLRSLRAIRVLEQIGSAEAREVLQTLAKGAPDDRLTREAETALKRLAK